ncbi:hypothetical protein, partial [Enterococcus faecium]|uniref:hypothetical protein n=1 Tax=Enterococcus faecium TaxID=1352 RepID=UPI00292E8C91
PYPQLAGVSIGIAISTFVTFICAAILLKLPNKEKENKTVKERIDNLFGVHSEGTNVIEKLSSYQTIGFPINTASLIMGGLVILG